MTLLQPATAHAVPQHCQPDAPEAFRDFAHQELALSTPWQDGICFNPSCGRAFNPTRRWQVYCCTACERAGTTEMRKWGHKMALPLLVWRMGKYEQHDEKTRALVKAARRHITHVQSAWLADRQYRAQQGGQE